MDGELPLDITGSKRNLLFASSTSTIATAPPTIPNAFQLLLQEQARFMVALKDLQVQVQSLHDFRRHLDHLLPDCNDVDDDEGLCCLLSNAEEEVKMQPAASHMECDGGGVERCNRKISSAANPNTVGPVPRQLPYVQMVSNLISTDGRGLSRSETHLMADQQYRIDRVHRSSSSSSQSRRPERSKMRSSSCGNNKSGAIILASNPSNMDAASVAASASRAAATAAATNLPTTITLEGSDLLSGGASKFMVVAHGKNWLRIRPCEEAKSDTEEEDSDERNAESLRPHVRMKRKSKPKKDSEGGSTYHQKDSGFSTDTRERHSGEMDGSRWSSGVTPTSASTSASSPSDDELMLLLDLIEKQGLCLRSQVEKWQLLGVAQAAMASAAAMASMASRTSTPDQQQIGDPSHYRLISPGVNMMLSNRSSSLMSSAKMAPVAEEQKPVITSPPSASDSPPYLTEIATLRPQDVLAEVEQLRTEKETLMQRLGAIESARERDRGRLEDLYNAINRMDAKSVQGVPSPTLSRSPSGGSQDSPYRSKLGGIRTNIEGGTEKRVQISEHVISYGQPDEISLHHNTGKHKTALALLSRLAIDDDEMVKTQDPETEPPTNARNGPFSLPDRFVESGTNVWGGRAAINTAAEPRTKISKRGLKGWRRKGWDRERDVSVSDEDGQHSESDTLSVPLFNTKESEPPGNAVSLSQRGARVIQPEKVSAVLRETRVLVLQKQLLMAVMELEVFKRRSSHKVAEIELMHREALELLQRERLQNITLQQRLRVYEDRWAALERAITAGQTVPHSLGAALDHQVLLDPPVMQSVEALRQLSIESFPLERTALSSQQSSVAKGLGNFVSSQSTRDLTPQRLLSQQQPSIPPRPSSVRSVSASPLSSGFRQTDSPKRRMLPSIDAAANKRFTEDTSDSRHHDSLYLRSTRIGGHSPEEGDESLPIFSTSITNGNHDDTDLIGDMSNEMAVDSSDELERLRLDTPGPKILNNCRETESLRRVADASTVKTTNKPKTLQRTKISPTPATDSLRSRLDRSTHFESVGSGVSSIRSRSSINSSITTSSDISKAKSVSPSQRFNGVSKTTMNNAGARTRERRISPSVTSPSPSITARKSIENSNNKPKPAGKELHRLLDKKDPRQQQMQNFFQKIHSSQSSISRSGT